MENRNVLSATDPDWSREEKPLLKWYPSRSLLGSIRAYQRASGPIGRSLAKWRHRIWSIVTGADIPVTVQIEGGLLLPHPNGVVISPRATIGPNCLLFQQVTIGATSKGTPTLGGHVDVGAGAKIIGDDWRSCADRRQRRGDDRRACLRGGGGDTGSIVVQNLDGLSGRHSAATR
jgi:serine O-acetyltransferase